MKVPDLVLVVLAGLCVVACRSSDAQAQPNKKPVGDVPLPKGDPIPDFVEPPWVPTNPDTSKHNKRGTDFGPCLSFTVQLDKKKFVRRGFTVQLPGQQAVCYDLDTLSVAASWDGGFLDISQTHYEDAKGKLPGRPGSTPTLWGLDTPGWADAKGSFADPRPNQLGQMPVAHLKYHGHFLHNYRVVLSYSVLGREVLEMPSAGGQLPPGALSRTFHVEPGKQPLRLLIAREKKGQWRPFKSLTVNAPENALTLCETQDGKSIAVGLVHAPKGCAVQGDGKFLYLSLPAATEALQFRLITLTGSAERIGALETYLQKKATIVADLRNYVNGGPPRWAKPFTLAGKVGPDDGPYAVDALALPDSNPWKSWIRPAAIDFFADGRLAMSSVNGDVWICSGIDKTLEKLQWRRYATGLYEPLGLKIVKDKLYVLGRDRITRLHDLNGDGEADFYQSFYAGGAVAPGYHAFTFDLQTDTKGNFYFAKSGRKVEDTPGCNSLVRISPDGTSDEIIATGFRHPNGMGIGPNDEIVVGDNQGEFVPSSKINLVQKGAYYGYGHLDLKYARPLLWLPMDQDNSCGGQLWAPANWGPLSGQMLHTSYGTCKLFAVFTQFDKDGPLLATAMPFDPVFASGIMRGRINPKDGQVYLCGLNGWGSKAKQDSSLDRVRHTGKPAHMIKSVTVVPKGLRLEFTCKVESGSATNIKNYALEQWGYIYSEKYGSPEMSIRNPGEKGHDAVTIKSAQLSADGTVVILTIPDLAPVDQLHLHVAVASADGHKIVADLFSTVHRTLR